MTPDVASLRALFRETVEQVIASGCGCPPGMDFDSPRPGVAPGNLWDPPSAWQSTERRAPISDIGVRPEEHPRRTELEESFAPADYLELNPDLRESLTERDAMEHFCEQGYRERRPYSKAIWGCLDPRFYALRHGFRWDDRELGCHYGYVGRYEDRFPNDLTEWVASTQVHLWQMGKVGSISIQRALLEQHGRQSIHLHYLDGWHREQPTIGVHYGRLLTHHGVLPKRVVCGVRDPIDRVVSGYFQEAESLGIEQDACETIEIAVVKLAERILSDLWNTASWFEHQFFCSLDLYKTPFDSAKGCAELRAVGVDVWLYNLRSLPSLGRELAGFLGVPAIELASENVSSKKRYGPMLELLRRCVDLPDRVLAALYECRYCRHFGFQPTPDPAPSPPL